MSTWRVGEYIICQSGDRFEVGRIKSFGENGAFVCYHEGETAAKTPFDCMRKLTNAYVIKSTTIGGEVFKSEAEKCQEED